MTTITLEYASPMIQEAANEEYTPIFTNKEPQTERPVPQRNEVESSPYRWEPEALKRLERAPEGFMRDCTRALIIKHAEKLEITRITLEVANEGIEQAKQTMEEAMKSGNVKEIIAKLTGAGAQP